MMGGSKPSAKNFFAEYVQAMVDLTFGVHGVFKINAPDSPGSA
jgi:hypothetical protein